MHFLMKSIQQLCVSIMIYLPKKVLLFLQVIGLLMIFIILVIKLQRIQIMMVSSINMAIMALIGKMFLIVTGYKFLKKIIVILIKKKSKKRFYIWQNLKLYQMAIKFHQKILIKGKLPFVLWPLLNIVPTNLILIVLVNIHLLNGAVFQCRGQNQIRLQHI